MKNTGGSSYLADNKIIGQLNLLKQLLEYKFVHLASALAGTMLGVSLALILTGLIFLNVGEESSTSTGLLPSAMSVYFSPKQRESGFIFISLVFGIAGSITSAYVLKHRKRGNLFEWIAIFVAIPIFSICIRNVLSQERWLFFSLICVFYSFIFFYIMQHSHLDSENEPPDWLMEPVEDQKHRNNQLPIHIGVVLLLGILLIPSSVNSVVLGIANTRLNSHIVSFITGPALYSWTDGLTPGIDYFTQYSVGLPALFSNFIGDTTWQTFENYIIFVVFVMIFFYISMFSFMSWFLRSWKWAIITTLTVMFLTFETEHTFIYPSNLPLRYPLLIISVLIFIKWINNDHSRWLTPILALSLGLSIFFNTETGIYIALAVALSTVVINPKLITALSKVIILGLQTIIILILINFIAFGKGALNWQYYYFLIEPLVIYGRGYSSRAISWEGNWYYLYNIISSGLLIGTLGWVFVISRKNSSQFSREQLAAIASFSLIGLLLLVKYANRPYLALWQLNSLGFFVICSWWIRYLFDLLGNFPQILIKNFVVYTRAIIQVTALFFIIGLLCFTNDPHNPTLYGLQSYVTYPSLINSLFGVDVVNEIPKNKKIFVSPVDVQLITDRTKPGEQVAIYGERDWVYLIEAHRSPKMSFIPSPYIFTDRQIELSIKDIDLIFLPKEPSDTFGMTAPSELADVLIPQLQEDFILDGVGQDLQAWRRVE